MTVFIRRAQAEDKTASECIRTVAATYGCKILRFGRIRLPDTCESALKRSTKNEDNKHGAVIPGCSAKS